MNWHFFSVIVQKIEIQLFLYIQSNVITERNAHSCQVGVVTVTQKKGSLWTTNMSDKKKSDKKSKSKPEEKPQKVAKKPEEKKTEEKAPKKVERVRFFSQSLDFPYFQIGSSHSSRR